MQYSMLWEEPNKLFPGLIVSAFYEPAAGDALVGGDFFDAFRLPDDSIMLAVGDITGKGLRAATRTVEARFALRAFAQDYGGPAETLCHLNRFMCDFHRACEEDVGDALVVLSLVVINAISGATQVASAGGDTLIMTTDGITEARQGLDFFGTQRLIETARPATERGTPFDVGKAILDAAHGHTGGRLNDDACLSLARRVSQ